MQKLIQHTLESVQPDLMIVLMCASETRAVRRGKRGTAEDVFEHDRELQERVTENYGRLGSLLPESEHIVCGCIGQCRGRHGAYIAQD
jgi:thymidylate kinase